MIGFHAQQAVEKWLKAAMALQGLPQTRIHDVDRLGEILEDKGVRLPVDRDRLDELTQYAVPLRYEDALDAEPLDRDATITLIETVDDWIRKVILAEGAEEA